MEVEERSWCIRELGRTRQAKYLKKKNHRYAIFSVLVKTDHGNAISSFNNE